MWDFHIKTKRDFSQNQCETFTKTMWSFHKINVKFSQKQSEIFTKTMWSFHKSKVKFSQKQCETFTKSMWNFQKNKIKFSQKQSENFTKILEIFCKSHNEIFTWWLSFECNAIFWRLLTIWCTTVSRVSIRLLCEWHGRWSNVWSAWAKSSFLL